jgi:hypothetical protein
MIYAVGGSEREPARAKMFARFAVASRDAASKRCRTFPTFHALNLRL